MFANKIFLIAVTISLVLSCHNHIKSTDTGFYRKFSFQNNLGEEKLDTFSMKANIKNYYYVDVVNDSFQLIYLFNNPNGGAFADFANAKKYVTYKKPQQIIYESDLDSWANGQGKEYILVNNSVFCKIILYYFLPPPPNIHRLNNRSVWLDYYDLNENNVAIGKRRLLISPNDTIDFKKNLTSFDRFKYLKECEWVDN